MAQPRLQKESKVENKVPCEKEGLSVMRKENILGQELLRAIFEDQEKAVDLVQHHTAMQEKHIEARSKCRVCAGKGLNQLSKIFMY